MGSEGCCAGRASSPTPAASPSRPYDHHNSRLCPLLFILEAKKRHCCPVLRAKRPGHTFEQLLLAIFLHRDSRAMAIRPVQKGMK